MNKQTITLPISMATDQATGIITAYIDGDYGTVTQGTDIDQVQKRLAETSSLINAARQKYGYPRPESMPVVQPFGGDFKHSQLTYSVVA